MYLYECYNISVHIRYIHTCINYIFIYIEICMKIGRVIVIADLQQYTSNHKT